MTARATERELLMLADGELEAADADRIREQIRSCPESVALAAGLAKETTILREELSPTAVPEDPLRREFGWVVAAGLALSVGLLAIRRAFFSARELVDAAPLSDPIPLVSWAGRFLVSLLDPGSLWNTITYGGIVVLTLFGIAALSSVLRRPRNALIPAIAVAALFQTAAPAEALRVLRDSECRIGAEEIVADDVVMFCDEAVIAGAVEGDVIFLAQSLDLTGHVEGDLMGVAEVVDISGTVDLGVRVGAQRVFVSGDVGRSLLAGAERIQVRPDATIGRAVSVFGSEIRIEGPVGGSLRAGGGNLYLDAEVGGGVRTSGESVAFGPGARALGPVVHTGAEEPEQPAGNFRVLWEPPALEEEEAEGVGDAAQRVVIRWSMGAVLGLVLLLVVGGPLDRIAATARHPVVPILAGAVLAVAVPILSALVLLTVIGIPLGITAFLVWAFALYAARIVIGLMVGELLLGPGTSRLDRFWRMALGLLLLAAAVEIPVLGVVIGILTALLGLGAVAIWAYRTREASRVEFAAGP